MEILPSRLFKLDNIHNIKISGRGGKEKEISSILINAKRVSSTLFDYEIDDGDFVYRLEIKKQANDQWFDIRKYYDLSINERDIILMFVIHKEDRITFIAVIQLGRLIDILLTHQEYKRYGWSPEVIKIANELYTECPELQFKAKLKVLPFVDKFRDDIQIIYDTKGDTYN